MKLIPNMALHVKEKTTPTLSIPVMEEMERMPCTSRRPDQRRIKNASPPSPAAPAGNHAAMRYVAQGGSKGAGGLTTRWFWVPMASSPVQSWH